MSLMCFMLVSSSTLKIEVVRSFEKSMTFDLYGFTSHIRVCIFNSNVFAIVYYPLYNFHVVLCSKGVQQLNQFSCSQRAAKNTLMYCRHKLAKPRVIITLSPARVHQVNFSVWINVIQKTISTGL
jgi:hypothetical protein